MTNEEKAKEIATENQEEYAECGSYSLKSYDECYDSALEMAEWKDQQYAKILTKLIVELDELKHQVKSLLP